MSFILITSFTMTCVILLLFHMGNTGLFQCRPTTNPQRRWSGPSSLDGLPRLFRIWLSSACSTLCHFFIEEFVRALRSSGGFYNIPRSIFQQGVAEQSRHAMWIREMSARFICDLLDLHRERQIGYWARTPQHCSA